MVLSYGVDDNGVKEPGTEGEDHCINDDESIISDSGESDDSKEEAEEEEMDEQLIHEQVQQMRQSFASMDINQLRLGLNIDLAAIHKRPLIDHDTHIQLVNDCMLRVFVCTWNMQGKIPKDRDELAKFIPANVHHIYCIGTQECQRTIEKSVVFRSKQRWEEILSQTFGPQYAMLESHTLMAMHIAIFVRRSLLPHIKDVRTSFVSCGVTEQIANKGANSISFTVGSTRMMFINCHLAAHQNNVDIRNEQYHAIIDGIVPRDNGAHRSNIGSAFSCRPGAISSIVEEPISSTSGSEIALLQQSGRNGNQDVIAQFDRILMFGDTNYRINGTRKVVDRVLQMGMMEVLVANDQLMIERAKGNAFTEFREGTIQFRPTYKFDPDSDNYDTCKKQRIPSWTDRILFRSNARRKEYTDEEITPLDSGSGSSNTSENENEASTISDSTFESISGGEGITLLEYDCASECRLSDHRPVFARFLIQVEGLSSQPSIATCRDTIISRNDSIMIEAIADATMSTASTSSAARANQSRDIDSKASSSSSGKCVTM